MGNGGGHPQLQLADGQPGGIAPANPAHLQVVPPEANNIPNPDQPRPPPVRDYRPRRFFYSRAQKDRAVRLLNMGIPCRQVARMIGPRCSSGTPIRWRQIARRQEEARRRLEEMMRARH